MNSFLSKFLERQSHLSHAAASVTALVMALAVSGCGADSVESLTASGQALAAKKDYKGAVIQFKTALQKDPQSAEARVLLGQALLDASDPAAAAAELTRALDQKVDANRVVPPLARAYLLTGEFKKLTSQFGDLQLADKRALASLKTSVATAWAAQSDRVKSEAALAAALAAQADFPLALVLQARIEAGQGRFDRATALVEEALKLDSRLYEAWHLKGEILLVGKRDKEAALKAFREALTIEPAYLPSHMALIGERINSQDVPGAQALAAELRKVLPRHPQTIYVDAQLAFTTGDFKKARELSQMLLRALPESSGVLQLAGAVEGQAGALVVAESHYAKALQLNPSLPLVRRNLGQVYLRLGQPQKTLDTLRPLLEASVQDPVVQAIAGEAYLRLGNLTAAESAFRQAATLQPDNVRVRTALALAHLSRGDTETAFAELATVASQSEKDTFADQAIISARLSRNEFDLALKAANAMVAKAPGKTSALELRGRIHSFRKDYVAARQDFELALKTDPALFSATVYLASLDILEEKPVQARQRLQTSVDTEPKNHFARFALADMLQRDGAPLADVRKLLTDGIKVSPAEPGLRLQLVDLLLVKRQFKDALAAAQEAVAALPAESRLLDALGRAQMDAGEVEQAITTFRRLAEKDLRDPMPHVRVAEIYRGTNRQPAAESAFRRALEIDPGLAQAQEGLARMMLRDGRLKEATELARKIQAQRPRSTSGYSLETTVLMRQKQVDAALAVYRRGLSVQDVEPELSRQYYVALQRAGRKAEAERFAAAWLKSHPDDVVFEYQVGVAAMERNEWAQAEARYLRVVQSLPKHVMALNNLAWVMASGGKSGGSAYAQRAVDLAPNKAELIDTLAFSLMVEKQPAKALELQKKAVELRPTEPAYRLSLARMAIEAGDKALARTELERLKALGASYPQQAEVAALAQKL